MISAIRIYLINYIYLTYCALFPPKEIYDNIVDIPDDAKVFARNKYFTAYIFKGRKRIIYHDKQGEFEVINNSYLFEDLTIYSQIKASTWYYEERDKLFEEFADVKCELYYKLMLMFTDSSKYFIRNPDKTILYKLDGEFLETSVKYCPINDNPFDIARVMLKKLRNHEFEDERFYRDLKISSIERMM